MKCDNQIELEFDDKSVTSLAGYPYGHEIYDTQLKDCLDFDKNFSVVFPDYIVDASSSFVQGLFAEVIKKIGLYDTINRVTIVSANQGFAQKVKERLI